MAESIAPHFTSWPEKQDPAQQNGNKFAIAKGNKDVEEKRFNAGVEKKPDKFYINNSLL